MTADTPFLVSFFSPLLLTHGIVPDLFDSIGHGTSGTNYHTYPYHSILG